MRPDEIRGLIADLTEPFGSVLSRLWLVGPGDLCTSCPMLAECPDQRRCLHLEASIGASSRLDGPFRRFPIGAARPVGRVALERTPFVARDHLPALGLADPSWLAGHAVQSFAAFPLAVGEELLGVLALFSHWRLDPRDIRSLAASARLMAGTLAQGGEPLPSSPLRRLADVQREAIERVLAHTGGRVSGPHGAAAILGLKPTTLHSRMRKLGVRRRPRD